MSDRSADQGVRRGGIESTIRAYDRELNHFLLRRLHGNADACEDIRQEIYLRMLRFSNADLIREPRAYLYRVARNVLHDQRLLREHETALTDDEAIAEDCARQADVARDLRRILSTLPPLYRSILILRAVEGLSYLEIAERLNVSIHTVKKYMHSALVECRKEAQRS